MNLNKYYYIGKIHLQNTLVYVLDFLISAGLIALIMFILISLWKVLYTGRTLIAGFNLARMVWYLSITEAISFMPLRSIIRDVESEVKSGAIAYSINKPYNYISAKFSSIAGFAILRFIFVLTSSIIMAFIFVGPIELNLYSILFLPITVFFSFTLSFLFGIGIALIAFWLEESYAFYYIFDKMKFLLGGFLFPLEILPLWLQVPAKYLPFSAILYYPAKLFVDFSFNFLLKTLLIQIGWIIIFVISIMAIYNIGIKKMSIHGG